MRVLICSSTYLPHLNGQAVFTVSLAEGLVANGHRVTLLVPREAGQPHHEIIQGVEVVRVPALRLGWIHPDLNIPFGIPPSIQRIFDQFQPQVVHVQDPSPLSQVVMRKARRLNIPVIADHHSGNAVTAPYFQTHHPLLKRITEWAAWRLLLAHLKQADLTIVPSRYSASNLESRGFHHPVRIIPCGVRLDVFHPAPSLDRQAVRQIYRLDSDKTLFLYVGRVDTEKRLEVILQAIARTKNENIQFAIAGRGNELASLQQLTERLNLSRKVRFLDQVDHDALPDLLNSADVFVMPGDSESFSIATLEAMACGKPILAVRSGALPQLVTHMENGFLYDARQPESAACGIEMLSIDQERRIQMGSLSLERARSYSQANIVRMYQETYRTSIGQKVNASSRNSAGDKARSPARRSILPALRAAMLLILLVISTIFYDEVQAVSNVKLSDLAPLNWTPGQRLLVIAPHPDDEVLAAGGLIQKTLETGGQVQVVIVTNGDAQYFAPLVVERKVRATQSDYINIGRQRQGESLEALKTLGVDQDAVDFLGYPDGGLYALWISNWKKSDPLRAPYTRAIRSPYEKTFDHDSQYVGSNLYNDLLKILVQFNPDVVVLPHPEDTNSDHSATSNFARFAIAEYLSTGDVEPPLILTYLIHYEAYPLPRGDNPEKTLLPPAPLAHGGEGWVTYALSERELSAKRSALRNYVSQQKMIGGYIQSFARANEIFFQLPSIDMPFFGFESAEPIETDFEIVMPESANERFSRLLIPSADLVGWKASRLGDVLCFAAETRGLTSPILGYRILVKLPGGEMLSASNRDDLIMFANDQFGVCYNLGALNYPPAIGFSAESRYGKTIDQTAWRFLRILYDE